MNRDLSKSVIRHALLVLLFGACIVFFMPHEQSYSYDYTVGKPWRYGQIIANYDFPIYKTEEAVALERDSIRHLYEPYFVLEDVAAEAQIRHLKSDFKDGNITGVPQNYINHIVRCLEKVYDKGIIDNEKFTSLLDSGVTNIRIVSGSVSRVTPLKELFTTRSAYLYIFTTDSANYKQELMQKCDISKYLRPNLSVDVEKSKTEMNDLLSQVLWSSGMVQSGQKIIDRGEIVQPETASILESMKVESLKRRTIDRKDMFILLGQSVFVLLVFLSIIYYLKIRRRDYLESSRYVVFIYFLITLFSVATSLIEYKTTASAYLIPYAMVPLFVSVFLDGRTAFVTHIATVLLCSLSVHAPFEFVLVQVLAGVVAIYSIKVLDSRSQVFRAALFITIGAALFMLGFDLSQGITPEKLDPAWYIYLVIGGILLLFAYPIMYIFEKLFGFTSSVTLIELSNVNTPLLRQLSKVAQGTFNHSMQVANLATEVAAKIGGKVELVRTGALYHDIGKIKNAAFFTENQSGVNPHDSLSEERSAQVIINHIHDGIELAEKYHLPTDLKKFIATHHGCSKTRYFYINYINKHPGENVNDALFTYPGPNPTTKEQAILMMADSVEAASRSLKIINEDTLRELVNKIIDGQTAEGLFKNSPITFHDIEDAKEQFVTSLKVIYHTRISYPEIGQSTKNNHGSSIFGGYRNWSNKLREKKLH